MFVYQRVTVIVRMETTDLISNFGCEHGPSIDDAKIHRAVVLDTTIHPQN